jgi:hypothetical protein
MLAVGGEASAGIGSAANSSCGSVTFFNGSIDVRGGTGLGVGWGEYGGASRLEQLTIYGGDIQARGTSDGSGIGSGRGYSGTSTIGNLTIVSGNITASSSSSDGYGSGIGTGYGFSGTSMIENLTIMNGNITASSSSSDGSGIGTGYGSSNGPSMIGNLTIMNGNITASSSFYGSGIGTGYGFSNGISMIGNLTIMNGNITTSSSSSGYDSRIGTGSAISNGISMIGNLTIMNGNITASSSYDGSGIGTGSASSNGTSMIGNLTIMNGNITASSSSSYGYGSGIGTGRGADDGISVIETLSVSGGRIRANGSEAGIGQGFEGSKIKLLRFSGIVVLFCTTMNEGKFPISASSIILSDTSLTIITPQNRVFSVNPFHEGSLNLSIFYGSVTSANSEPLWLLNSTFLQIGNISVPISRFWTFCISGICEERCIEIESTTVRSLIFSVRSQGNYSIRGLNEGLIGLFETETGLSSFDVSSNFPFIPEAHFIIEKSPTFSLSVDFHSMRSESGIRTSESGIRTSESRIRTSKSRIRTSKSRVQTNESGVPSSEAGALTNEGLSGGAITVIVVVCAVVVGLIVGMVIFVLKKQPRYDWTRESTSSLDP